MKRRVETRDSKRDEKKYCMLIEVLEVRSKFPLETRRARGVHSGENDCNGDEENKCLASPVPMIICVAASTETVGMIN